VTNIIEVALNKKLENLTQQLDTADQKARYVTLQWQSDKSRFKEQMDAKKTDIDELTNRLIVMENRVRLAEQMNRDKFLIQKSSEAAVEEEISEVCTKNM
jgi:hypothetical protein